MSTKFGLDLITDTMLPNLKASFADSSFGCLAQLMCLAVYFYLFIYFYFSLFYCHEVVLSQNFPLKLQNVLYCSSLPSVDYADLPWVVCK